VLVLLGETAALLLEQFRKALGETYAREHGERSALRNELEALRKLNAQLGTEAGNLTRALKGDSRTQGAWGEMVLERVLEASGLERGRAYETQTTLHDEHHARQRPDVIVHLPEGKDLVIDAKVALTSYERYCSATDDAQRALDLGDHVQALRRHVATLAERGYAQLPGLRTLDFVLMFVPVEGAMSEAVRADPELYTYALTRHIALVSPSTLLATLRTVSHLWRMEDRNANAAEIADKAGRMYDAFVKLAEDLRKVRTQMQRTQDLLDESLGRVEGGRGNLVSRSEQLRRLGAKARKRLPPELAERAVESDADSPEWDAEIEPIQPDLIGTRKGDEDEPA
jgi:DNA recombination protein RmuC